MSFISDFWTELVKLTVEMAPYLLLGFLFAGILYAWLPAGKITRYLGKNNASSVVNAALLGIPLPLCSCGVIPTGISFYRSGALPKAHRYHSLSLLPKPGSILSLLHGHCSVFPWQLYDP
jgi:uncharacterized membrane protein YraQ (UPF0718 family)